MIIYAIVVIRIIDTLIRMTICFLVDANIVSVLNLRKEKVKLRMPTKIEIKEFINNNKFLNSNFVFKSIASIFIFTIYMFILKRY